MEIMYILRGGGSSFVDDVLMGLSSLTAFHLRPFPGGVKKSTNKWKGGTKITKNKPLRRISYKSFSSSQP